MECSGNGDCLFYWERPRNDAPNKNFCVSDVNTNKVCEVFPPTFELQKQKNIRKLGLLEDRSDINKAVKEFTRTSANIPL